MISHLREHRLCHLKIEDINKQRKAAGVAPIATPVVNAKDRTYTMSAPVGTNTRSAQANAAQQTQQYQANLKEAQKTPYVATYIDPATGKDTRNPTTVNTPVYYGATPENPTGTGEVSHWDTNTTMDQGKLIGSDGEPYTGQQPKQSVPKTSAEYRAAPTTGPVSTVTTLPKPAFTSQDLQAAVAQRREKRLGELGVQQGDIDKVNSLLEQGYTFNNSTMDGRPIFTKNGNQSDYVVLEGFSEDKLRAVDEAKNADFTKEVTDEMAAADAAAKTARAETAKATKTAVGDTSPAAPAATPIKGPDFSMFDSQIAQINAMVQADPNLAATYTPLLMSLAARRTQLENDFNIATTQFNNQDKDNDGVADGVQEAYGEGVEAAERRANEADRINLENRDINLAAANLAKDMAEIAQKKFELEQHRNEQLVIEQNVERERKNRLIANKLGIASGGNGLRWMAEEVRKGNDMLSYLKQAGSLQEASFALETGRTYAINVRQATNNYDAQKMKIDTQFSNDVAELNKMVNLDAKERKEERKTMVKEYMDALDKNDEKFADQVKLFNDQMAENIKQAAKDKADSVIKSKDTIAFISDVSKELNNNNIIKNARTVRTQFSALESEYNRAKSASAEGKSFSDQTLISLFNKIMDPTSVVREAEYNRSAENLALADQAFATLSKFAKGGVLTDKVRTELFNAAKTLSDTYNRQLQDEYQPYIARANLFNSQDGVQAKVKLGDIIPPNLIPYVPQDVISNWEAQMGVQQYDTSGTENPTGELSWKSPNDPARPSMGWRTDRHNNPTAFTVDVAAQGGLKEGEDYVIDKELQNGFPTAKIIGDPFEKTIKVIDNIGFYTKSGGNRWTHTAMSKEDWDSKTYQQKLQVVLKMYQREGGDGQLAAKWLNNNPNIAYTPATPYTPA